MYMDCSACQSKVKAVLDLREMAFGLTVSEAKAIVEGKKSVVDDWKEFRVIRMWMEQHNIIWVGEEKTKEWKLSLHKKILSDIEMAHSHLKQLYSQLHELDKELNT